MLLLVLVLQSSVIVFSIPNVLLSQVLDAVGMG